MNYLDLWDLSPLENTAAMANITKKRMAKTTVTCPARAESSSWPINAAINEKTNSTKTQCNIKNP